MIMKLKDLSLYQIEQLKIQYYIDNIDDSPSFDELANMDDLVSYSQLEKEYGNVIFTNDDFCN